MSSLMEAALTLVGMIIGVGMFGIPYSFVSAGFWLGGTELIFLALVVLLLHLIYAEIVLATDSFHRLPGYVRIYLGKNSAALSWCSAIFGISGSLLAYLIVGSTFLYNIFGGARHAYDIFLWVIFLVMSGAVITFFPLRKESWINGWLTFLLIVFAFGLILWLAPEINSANFTGTLHVKNLFVPYGVLLFALSGGIVIPDIVTLVGRHRHKARRVITFGSLLPALIYLLFAWAVVGVSGRATSPEAISGLAGLVGHKIIILGSVVGFLAVFTSFIASSKNFQEMLKLDFKIPGRPAWLLVTLLPLFLYVIGLQNFIMVIGLVGALGIGIDSGLILTTYYKIKKRTGDKLSFWSYLGGALIYIIIVGGVIYEIYKFWG